MNILRCIFIFAALALGAARLATGAEPLPIVSVEGQPLAANTSRLIEAFVCVGAPLPASTRAEIGEAARRRDAERLQQILDPGVLMPGATPFERHH